MLEPKEDPGSFQLAPGLDHIEIVVKTVDLGDSSTPGTTMAGPNNNRNSLTLSNRSSGRRNTVMTNMPFIPESPSANKDNNNEQSDGGNTRFSFSGLGQSAVTMPDQPQDFGR